MLHIITLLNPDTHQPSCPLQAQQKDPRMAMAYFGEAMSYKQPLWQMEDLDAAAKVFARYDRVFPDKTKVPGRWRSRDTSNLVGCLGAGYMRTCDLRVFATLWLLFSVCYLLLQRGANYERHDTRDGSCIPNEMLYPTRPYALQRTRLPTWRLPASTFTPPSLCSSASRASRMPCRWGGAEGRRRGGELGPRRGTHMAVAVLRAHVSLGADQHVPARSTAAQACQTL